MPRNVVQPGLHHEPLFVDSAVVVARVGHPLARRRTLGAGDLALYPWVLARRWELERKALDELFAEAGLAPIEPEIETTSATLMKTLVAQSDFLTFVPREMIYWEERMKLLRPLRAIRCSWARHVGVTTRRDTALPAAGAQLIACLRESVGARRARLRPLDAKADIADDVPHAAGPTASIAQPCRSPPSPLHPPAIATSPTARRARGYSGKVPAGSACESCSTNCCSDYATMQEMTMNDETFNLSIRKFLKMVGVKSQHEIEQAVVKASASGAIAGTETFPATMTLHIAGLQLEVKFDGEIRLQ